MVVVVAVMTDGRRNGRWMVKLVRGGTKAYMLVEIMILGLSVLVTRLRFGLTLNSMYRNTGDSHVHDAAGNSAETDFLIPRIALL
jgi:hypothetical protein